MRKGFIERVGASEVTGDDDCSAMEQVKGYRLIKPYVREVLWEEEEEGPRGGEEDDEDDETVSGKCSVMAGGMGVTLWSWGHGSEPVVLGTWE